MAKLMLALERCNRIMLALERCNRIISRRELLQKNRLEKRIKEYEKFTDLSSAQNGFSPRAT